MCNIVSGLQWNSRGSRQWREGLHVDICHSLYQGKTQWREGYMLTFFIACIRVRHNGERATC